MDAKIIGSVMHEKGFASDMAFNALTFLIDTIPCMDGCPLGLYYADTATIVLPPDADESTLLHEAGHRYGHYHYGDLSEEFAERFRMKYDSRVLMFARGSATCPSCGSVFNLGGPQAQCPSCYAVYRRVGLRS